jgi:hypothetical protein
MAQQVRAARASRRMDFMGGWAADLSSMWQERLALACFGHYYVAGREDFSNFRTRLSNSGRSRVAAVWRRASFAGVAGKPM